MAMKPRLCLSHPWAANTHHFALRLIGALRNREYSVWIDEDQMTAGQSIAQRQISGIRSETDIFLFTLSRASLDSTNCLDELQVATSAHKPTISLRLDQVEMPPGLAARIAVDFTNPVFFDASIDRLTQGCNDLYRVELIARCLDDDDPDRRSEAARLLKDLNATDALPHVISHMKQERDPTVLYWLLLAAARLAKLRPDMVNCVQTTLNEYRRSTSPLIARGALEGINDIHPTENLGGPP